MPILSAYIVPHPPLLVPEVGNGQEEMVQRTVDSYHKVAKRIAEEGPETIIIFSPHAPAYFDYIHVASGSRMEGNMELFGADFTLEAKMDESLTEEITRICKAADFPAGTLGGQTGKMDHGTLVPLSFVNQYFTDYQLVLCSLSGLPREEHYRFGMYLYEAVQNLGRKVVVVASGDLSHKLKETGPYSFAKEGPELDRQLTDVMKSGEVIHFLTIEEELCGKGAECGLGSFIMMAGMLDGKSVKPEFLSYEGTFGVGYAVCIFQMGMEDESEYVRLARMSLEHFIHTDRLMNLPKHLPEQMINQRAGVFVSIKKDGNLRGCIGTTEATQENIASEILYNAILAGTRDSRFPLVRKEELPELTYSVDVLTEAEAVSKKEDLDPKKFGVIVSHGNKRGLLLPNLDGVDTVEQQLDIACQKAGIGSTEDYEIKRFEVVRYR